MKKRTLSKLFIAVFIAMLIFPAHSNASHAAGGELIYQWISDSTYRFIFKFYRDCTGVASNGSQELCFNPDPLCANAVSFSTFMNPWTGPVTGGLPNGSKVSIGCPGYLTKCQDTTSPIIAYEEWWYSAVVTLPGKCDHWRFSTDVNERNPSDNLVTIGTMYIEGTFNNLLFEGNSSPYFFVLPVPYFPINIPYKYSNGAMDPNLDSLATELVMPRNSHGCGSLPSAAGLVTGLNLTNNPFPTGSTFSLNGQTQQMSFTATQVGTFNMTTRVKEYRNGVLIGHIDRDIQTNVINFSPSTVVDSLDTTTFANVTTTGGTIFRTNSVLPISFCFDIKASVPGTVLVPYDNHSVVCPGSTLTYTNLNTDSVRGCFSWTPATTDSGIRMLTIIVKDSTCIAPGIMTYWSFSYPIFLDTLPLPTSVNANASRITGTTIYPNPAHQTLTIKTPVKYTTAFISNSTGQLLLQQEMNKAKSIDISTLPAGLYYLQLRANNEETETLKFTKE